MNTINPRPRPRTPLSQRVLAAALLLVFGIGLGAVAFEVMVRTFVPVSDFFWEWDSSVGLKLIPNKRGRWVKRGLFDVPVNINSHGFRDREHSYSRSNAAPRIVL